MSLRFESAAQAVEWINGLRYAGAKNGLANMRALLERLGNPQNALACAHVAGTNGKGSTCAMLERMLRACGLKTGLYTSPYLMRYEERMRVNGAPIPEDALVEIASDVREAAEALVEQGVRPTTFELGTAVAFCYFRRERVEVAVIEVGLGGRLDPTNVILPEISLIAAIGLDHMKLLGGTLPEIAFEKAGIIKPGVPAAALKSGDEAVTEVFRSVAARQGSELTLVEPETEPLSEDEYGSRFLYRGQVAEIRLAGRHQIGNARLALAGMELLRERGWTLDEARALQGLKAAVWPGRLEWIGNLLIDGAHNPHGARSLARYAETYLKGRNAVLLVGMMRDKDVEACVSIYREFARRAVATQVSFPRAMPAEALAELCERANLPAEAVPDIPNALARAKELAGEYGVVIVAGSLYLAGEVRIRLRDDKGIL